MTLYFSRLRIARRPSTDALRRMIDPTDPNARIDAHHKLLWSAFSDDPDRRRDFLWRAEGRGTFLTLSQRAPIGNDLFDQVDVRDFAPSLRVGDRLSFALRANATRTKRDGGRVDVVMDALRLVPQAERAARRMQIAQTEATAWLERQGARAGFELHTTQAEEYTTLALSSHRGPRKGRPQFGILSLSGMIEVTDPDKLLAQIGHGFGRAKAYGCGLMLIRRSL